MGLNFFSWGSGSTNLIETTPEIPNIFPMSLKESEFVKVDVDSIYTKILTDVVERTQGIPNDVLPLFWDNCLGSESSDGLITMVAKAMSRKEDLFLIYEKALKVVRKAKGDEIQKIKEDYAKEGESEVGVYVSFKNYTRSDMVRLYSALEYCTIASLHKTMNLSKAIQIKVSSLRSAVNLTDSSVAKAQGAAIADGLGKGNDVLLDKDDIITTTTADLTAIKSSIEFLNEKRAFYLGLPASYINGILTGGLGSSGEADTKAIERGLKNYFSSVIKPLVDKLFSLSVTYKSQDFRQIAQALEALKTFEIIGEGSISAKQKQLIINGLLDLEVES